MVLMGENLQFVGMLLRVFNADITVHHGCRWGYTSTNIYIYVYKIKIGFRIAPKFWLHMRV